MNTKSELQKRVSTCSVATVTAVVKLRRAPVALVSLTCLIRKSVLTHIGAAYNSDGLLIDPSQPVLECHTKCQCDATCVNRQVSRGPRHTLALTKTPHKGWALITRSSIRAGAFIVEYTGELISTQETQRRFTNYDAASVNYLLVLREWRSVFNNTCQY